MRYFIFIAVMILMGCNERTCKEEFWSNQQTHTIYCVNKDSSYLTGQRFWENGTTDYFFFWANGKGYKAYYYQGDLSMINHCDIIWKDGIPICIENGLRVAYRDNRKSLLEIKQGIANGKYVELNSENKVVCIGIMNSGDKNGVWRYFNADGKITNIEVYKNGIQQ